MNKKRIRDSGNIEEEDDSNNTNTINTINNSNNVNEGISNEKEITSIKDYLDIHLDEDLDLPYEIQEKLKNKNNNNNPNENLTNIEFEFSCIKPEYFIMIKNLIRPNYIFENVSMNGLSDLIIKMKEDIGITIKISGDEDNKILAVFTLIPFKGYIDNPVIEQIKEYLYNKEKIDNKDKCSKIIKLLSDKKSSFAYLINERIINLPEELIPPAYNLLYKELTECLEETGNKCNGIEYIFYISKYLKIKENNEIKNIYYKYEQEIFNNLAKYKIEYKIPYRENDMFLEFDNEPQYMQISFISFLDFYNIIKSIAN